MKTDSKSFFRREQNKALSRLRIDGCLLDVGGTKNAAYHRIIGGEHTVVVGNIDPRYGFDVKFDAEGRWPFEDNHFDGVLLMNLLEHLYEYQNALSEARRVLKPGGVLAGVVPFLLNVHGTPHDYFRYTKSALERLLADAGFVQIEVRELGTGVFSVTYQCLLGFVRWNWMATVLIPLFRSLDSLVARLKPRNKLSAEFMPLGYYFEARKK